MVSENKVGFVYIFVNGSNYNEIKIGETSRNQFERLKELDSTGIPRPHLLRIAWRTDDRFWLENYLHRLMLAHRIRSTREWFELIPNENLYDPYNEVHGVHLDFLIEYIESVLFDIGAVEHFKITQVNNEREYERFNQSNSFDMDTKFQ